MASMKQIVYYASRIREEVSKVVIGSEKISNLFFITLLSGEHVFIEGPPGTAKTLVTRAFAKACGLTFRRIQMTVETMPSDVTGFYVYTLSGQRVFRRGPVFSNILLVDELNRAPPRTQSALLEAMQERQVTIEGDTYKLPTPFIVLATQMPYGAVGTYALPEVIIDRFALKLNTGMLKPELEKMVLEKVDVIESFPVRSVTSGSIILGLMNIVRKVRVDDDVARYIVNIVNYIRGHSAVDIGPSTRASVHLYKLSRAYASLHGRDYVIPDDVKIMAPYVLGHRVRIKPQLEYEGLNSNDIVREALENVKVPK